MNRESPHAEAVNGNRDAAARPSPVPGPPRMRQVLDAIPPASGGIVLACGIVSVDLNSDHQPVLSAIMLWFAAGVWLLLAVMLGMRLAYQRDRLGREARSPAAFTGAAGTAVLGTRLAIADYHVAAAALLAVAGLCWALLVVPVLRHWKAPTAGISFLLAVATESLAVLGATLAVSYRAGWLVSAAVVAHVLGLACYVFFTAARFDPRDLLTGRGDHWIAGGALAISALSGGKITQAADALGQFSGLHQVFTISTLVLWCLAMAWLLPLITGEILRPRLGYDIRRWATVFPLGVYAAASFTTGQVTGITGITGFGQVWTWVAFTASLLALAGLIRHGWPVLRGQRNPARAAQAGRHRPGPVPADQAAHHRAAAGHHDPHRAAGREGRPSPQVLTVSLIGGRFLASAHRCTARSGRCRLGLAAVIRLGCFLAAVRLFHLSITYLTLLFSAITVTACCLGPAGPTSCTRFTRDWLGPRANERV